MKLRLFAALLTLTLLLMTFSGCGWIIAERQADMAEEAIEHRAEQVEEKVESAVRDAITREPDAVQSSSAQDVKTELTAEQAQAIALEHANVQVEDAERLYAEYEVDDRVPQYDVQFWKDHVEYEYEIHAETGEILSYEQDR